MMKKSGEVVAKVLNKIEELAKPGITTKELDQIAEEIIINCGGVPSFKGYKIPGMIPFPASICASLNDEVVHGIPNKKRLIEGDILSVDVGVYLNGYHGDAARTFKIGKVSEVANKLVDVTKESFYAGIKKATVGNRIYDISSEIQDIVEKNSFSIVRDFVGHGIGKNLHEEPQIPHYRTKIKGPRLLEGMVLAIEPMVNEGNYTVKSEGNGWRVITGDGKLSSHYENTVAITDNGPIILTEY